MYDTRSDQRSFIMIETDRVVSRCVRELSIDVTRLLLDPTLTGLPFFIHMVRPCGNDGAAAQVQVVTSLDRGEATYFAFGIYRDRIEFWGRGDPVPGIETQLEEWVEPNREIILRFWSGDLDENNFLNRVVAIP